jgi:cell division protein FtsI (penicillin-binding protein 3)
MSVEIQKSRLAFLYFAILAVFLIIIIRIFFIISFGDKNLVSKSYDLNRLGKRGNIIDRNGVLLASDLKTKSLYISSILVKDKNKMSREIARIFPDLSYNEVLKKISRGLKKRDWILIRRNLTPNQVQEVREIKMAGLIFENDRKRVYPQKSIASHFVGYVDLDRKGLSGIEMQYDKKLASGENIQLTLDVRLQDVLHDELVVALDYYKAKAAAGIILDVTSGEVLALSSLPDFDLNLQEYASSDQRFNRVVNGVYELGSVMKIFTNAIAFDNNLVKLNDVYNVSDPIKYGRFTIKDDHKYKDEMTVAEIFSHSSNIGTIKIAEKIGIEAQKEFFKKAGLLKKLNADFPGLGRPIYPRIWREINLFTIAYGHGIAVTPLHLATSVGAMINGGLLFDPVFVKSDKKQSGKQIIKESTSEIMRFLMKKTANDGTGRFANVEGYDVGGKTGTANRAEGGGYNERSTIASFVAAFPISNPKYLVYVIFDRPNFTFNTGGMVAAPVAGKIIKNIAPIIDIHPSVNLPEGEK